MRPFSARMFPNSVTITRSTYPVGSQGGANPSPTGSPQSHRVTFQPRPASMSDTGSDATSREGYRAWAMVGFQADPDVNQGDEIRWDDVGGLIYTAQGPATQDGGRSGIWWVNCQLSA